jgi:ketosteroid isomerase-like protein
MPADRPDLVADDRAVRQLVSAYSDAVSHLDAARAAATYAPDGVVSIVGIETSGRAAIEQGMRDSFGNFQLLQMIAHSGLISIESDRAVARWSTIELGVRHGQSSLHCILGRYEDELVRLPTGWRFRKRVFTLAGRTLLEASKVQVNPEFARSLINHGLSL